MFKKGDFKKLQVLGAGKKNTKIYKAVHVTTGKVYALKQIQAKNLDKLNEYKQQAVQLMKVQHHSNVVSFYGYYFSQTKYSSFKLGLVTEFMDGKTNLQYIYRKRKKANQYWKQDELVNMFCSMVATNAFLQSKSICHRDIKPANIFVLPNNQLKLIDFGQSKDYFWDPNDHERDTFTMATIRGTPQYLSPILWKAHVIDGNSRFAEHNIYKSDVFSTGLVLFQIALMNEVTGFNYKTLQVDGQKLIRQNVKILQKMYSPAFAQLISLLVRFDQSERPSFCEIESLFLEKQMTCRQKGKPLTNQYIKYYNQYYNNLCKTDHQNQNSVLNTNATKSVAPMTAPVQNEQATTKADKDVAIGNQVMETRSKNNNYYKDSTLMLHESCYWFQFGGSSIGRFSVNRLKWKVDQGNQGGKRFPYHFSVVFIPTSNSYYLLGGPLGQNFRVFQSGKRLTFNKCQMPTFRNFFPAVYHSQKVYTFGGYDGELKKQLKSSQYYDIVSGKWFKIADMKTPRSQSGACRINDDQIIVCGGYNKELGGTLDTIERYIISNDKFDTLSLKLPIPLRRMMVVRVAKNIALILGGLTVSSKQSQRVFKLDYEKFTFFQLQNLEKGGVIENQILVDSDGSLHIFLQHANGTSPHSHIKYPYDPTQEGAYQTKHL